MMGPAGFLALAFVYLLLARVLPPAFRLDDGLRLASMVLIGHATIYLFPVPPLDGARAVRALGGPEVRRFLAQLESYGPIGFLLIFLLLSYTGVLAAIERGLYGFLLSLLRLFGL